MDLHLDHVTVAGRDLDALRTAFARAGLPAEYGGRHSNGVTHMALVGFSDGSYIECLSAFDETVESPWWHEPIHRNGGPCGWAVRVDDIGRISDRLRDRDIDVDGPSTYCRERDDGTLVEWELTYLGDGDPGRTLPFLIEDRTPRERRVTPTADLADGPITGVEQVVLAVTDLGAAMDRFRTAFELEPPRRFQGGSLPVSVASFPATPVVLAEPDGTGWLQERLEAFGPLPAAYLLGVETGAECPLPTAASGTVAGQQVDWVALETPIGRPYLGAVES